jgi:hypothetical protein
VLGGSFMRRFWLLSALLLLPRSGWTEGVESPELQEARLLMTEGLERELPSPALRGPPQWPSAVGAQRPAPLRDLPGKGKPGELGELSEKVRNEASLRARALAEERRAAPDNQPGVGQSRTRAAKGLGPPLKPKPPRP